MPLVRNQFPKHVASHRRLAIVGEAPGADEEQVGLPFVGSSGKYLRIVLGSVGFSADQCLLANVCQIRPPDNDIEAFDFHGPEIQSGLAQLKSDLDAFAPNCILTLGKTAFRALNPEVCYLDSRGNSVVPISNWRGSLFRSCFGPKGVGTFHPAYILRAYADSGLFRFDVARAVNQSASAELSYRSRTFTTRPSLEQVLTFLEDILRNERTISFDIEGVCDNVGVTMVSIFTSPDVGIVIPFWIDGRHYWDERSESSVWAALGGVLSSDRVRKITQYGLYELFVLLWKHKIVVTNITEDTMLKHWELFPEFDKSLAVQTSIYTLEPYYKDDRTSNDTEVKLIYSGKDSAVTFECSLEQDKLLQNFPRSGEHYRFNVSLFPAFAYMSLRGVKLDQSVLLSKKSILLNEINSLQAEVDARLVEPALAADVLTRKRKSDPWTFNVKSAKQKNWLLYEYFAYKPYARKGTVSDEETLHRYYQKNREPVLKTIIQLVNKRTQLQDLNKLETDADGRLRCSYNPVGTVTGRLSSSSSFAMLPYFTKTGVLHWDYTGTNMQNQAKSVRECLVADDGFLFFQCDLAGADAWTVAADLSALGHPTMLEDLRAGIRPAKVLLCMLQEYEAGRNPGAFNQLSRDEIKARTAALNIPKGLLDDGRPGDWKYTCMKRVQHGTNYGMAPDKLSETIFKDSDGLIDLPRKDAELYQSLYRLRYNPDARSEWIRTELRTRGAIQTASGIRRKFYSLRGPGMVDDAVLREALSTEPQANTTYVCNRGLHALWHDPENRTSSGGLFVEPLIQIHDAIAGQFRAKHLDWARKKIVGWMTHTIKIHGIDITIPFEGKFGPNWLKLDNDL